MGEELVLVVKRPRRRRRIMVGIAAGVCLLLICAATIWFIVRDNSRPAVTIPHEYAQKVTFPLYVPKKLPEGYVLDFKSFQIKDEVLFFWIKNGDKKVIFAEEIKPIGFDFQAFYRQQMNHPKSVPDAPFASVIGDIQDGKLLSIIDDQTWLLITGKGATESDLQFIANNMVSVK